MKYYIGYFNKPGDKSEFTVIAATPTSHAAQYILEAYKNNAPDSWKDIYTILTAADAMDKTLVF